MTGKPNSTKQNETGKETLTGAIVVSIEQGKQRADDKDVSILVQHLDDPLKGVSCIQLEGRTRATL